MIFHYAIAFLPAIFHYDICFIARLALYLRRAIILRFSCRYWLAFFELMPLSPFSMILPPLPPAAIFFIS